MNNFIVNTTKFLNRFSNECELKLADVSNRITNTETSLSVLECKLRSIPGLEFEQPTDGGHDVRETSPPSAELAPNSEIPAELPTETSEATNALVVVEKSDQVSSSDPIEEEATPASGKVKACEHPDYVKYYKMAKLGVVHQSVMQRMNSEAPHLVQALEASHAQTPDIPFFEALVDL